MARFIIAHRNDRLGTKLQTIVSAGRIADKVGAQLLISWGLNAPSLNPKNIFAEDFCTAFDENEGAGTFIHPDFIQTTKWKLNSDFYDKGVVIPEEVENSDVLMLAEPAVLRMPDEVEEEAKQDYISYWNGLALNPGVVAEYAKFCSAYDLTKHIGVHIRRGDIVRRIRKVETTDDERLNRFCTQFLNRYIYDDAYFAAIDEICAGENLKRAIFLCSDAQTTFKKYISRYGLERIVYFNEETSKLNPDQLALLDIMLLAKTEIIVSGGSLFAHFAANISNAKQIDLRTQYDWRKVIEEAQWLIRERDRGEIAIISGVMNYHMARRLNNEERLDDALDAVWAAIACNEKKTEYLALKKNIVNRKAASGKTGSVPWYKKIMP